MPIKSLKSKIALFAFSRNLPTLQTYKLTNQPVLSCFSLLPEDLAPLVSCQCSLPNWNSSVSLFLEHRIHYTWICANNVLLAFWKTEMNVTEWPSRPDPRWEVRGDMSDALSWVVGLLGEGRGFCEGGAPRHPGWSLGCGVERSRPEPR